MNTFNSVSVEFSSKDHNWQDENTTYWFELMGVDYHTGDEFDCELFGIVESSNYSPTFVDCDGCPTARASITRILGAVDLDRYRDV